MLDLVTGAFSQKELLLIEAPTGIGKTFAYGVPSILYSIRTGTQVFISTNTKTLQDQIFEKDIPMLHTLFGRHSIGDFSVAKIKGRSNYVSLLLLFEYMDSHVLDEAGIIFLLKIVFWLGETRYGEIDELVFYGGEYQLLDKIRATDKRVLSPDNPYRKEEFLYRIRQDAKNANIVIMNHSLLLSEIEMPEEGGSSPVSAISSSTRHTTLRRSRPMRCGRMSHSPLSSPRSRRSISSSRSKSAYQALIRSYSRSFARYRSRSCSISGCFSTSSRATSL